MSRIRWMVLLLGLLSACAQYQQTSENPASMSGQTGSSIGVNAY